MSVEVIQKASNYLTFTLEEEVFAIDISKVHEVLDFKRITKVPRTPDFMRGVINLRGRVVPVIDLRLKLGMTSTEQTVDTCIIIMEISLDDGEIVLGALTDSVQEVLEIEPGSIEPAPSIGTRLDTEFINGMAKLNEQFAIILDVDKVFTSAEIAVVQATGKKSSVEEDEAVEQEETEAVLAEG